MGVSITVVIRSALEEEVRRRKELVEAIRSSREGR